MKLVYLGTSAAQPTKSRGLTCICLQRQKEILMFDAGEGTQRAFMKARLGWNKPMKIFVTHIHGDHCIGILGLLQTMSLQKRTQKLEIYGPKGVEEFIAANIKILKFGLSFPIMITTIDEGKIFEDKEFTILACKAQHSIEAFSYVFEEKQKLGKFQIQKAQELEIPKGELWHKLQNGEKITHNGKEILPHQVLGEKRRGKKIGISGDTRPTKELTEFFKECDYLSFDSTFSYQLLDKAKDTYHTTAKEAATLAKNANVKNLILTHFSARYTDVSILLNEAKAIHNSVIAAEDQLEIEIE